jgi:hypothetical protein
MKTRFKWSLVNLGVGAAAFALTPVNWPLSPAAQPPPGNLLPLFILLGALESLAVGLGVAFLLFGRQWVGSMGVSPGLSIATYISIAWLLVNWWPHDNLHRVVGLEWSRLMIIEYSFHLPLLLAAAVVAWFFVSLSRRESAIA